MTYEETQQKLEPYEGFRKAKWTDPPAKWNDERIGMLKTLWGQGRSASQIAARLGGVSRNGVIGKIHRLGLSKRVQLSKSAYTPNPREKRGNEGRQNTAKAKTAARRIGQSTAPNPPAEPIGPFAEIDVPIYARKTLMERTAHEDRTLCKWIIGDPKTPEHHYCHANRAAGFSYCLHHARATYQPPEMMLRRRGRLPFLPNVRPYPTHGPEDIPQPEPESKVA